MNAINGQVILYVVLAAAIVLVAYLVSDPS